MSPRRSARPGSARSRGWGGACAGRVSWLGGGDSRVLDDSVPVLLEVEVGDAARARLVVQNLRRAPLRLARSAVVTEDVAGLAVLAVRVLVVARPVARQAELARVVLDHVVELTRRPVGVPVE